MAIQVCLNSSVSYPQRHFKRKKKPQEKVTCPSAHTFPRTKTLQILKGHPEMYKADQQKLIILVHTSESLLHFTITLKYYMTEFKRLNHSLGLQYKTYNNLEISDQYNNFNSINQCVWHWLYAYFMPYSPYAKWKVNTNLTLRKMSEELRSTSDSLFSFFSRRTAKILSRALLQMPVSLKTVFIQFGISKQDMVRV